MLLAHTAARRHRADVTRSNSTLHRISLFRAEIRNALTSSRGVHGQRLRRDSDHAIQPGAPVLLVEDDRDLADEIRAELQGDGHPVRARRQRSSRAFGSAARRRRGPHRRPHADGEDGLKLVETLRDEGNPVPVLSSARFRRSTTASAA